jgi:hypothetical protein
MAPSHMLKNGVNQLDQESQAQARQVEQPTYPKIDEACEPTIRHQTPRPCRQLWASVEEEVVGL